MINHFKPNVDSCLIIGKELMKKHYLKKISLVLAPLCLSIPVTAQADTLSSIKDNYFCFADPDTNNFIPMSFHIYDDNYTIGNPADWSGIQMVTTGKTAGCINVRAGRSADTANADWVSKKLSNLQVSWDGKFMSATDENPGSTPPKALNFAFYGELKIKINNDELTCENVIIGQGSHRAYENWWVFNNSPKEAGTLICKNSHNDNVYLYLLPGWGDGINNGERDMYVSLYPIS